MNKKLTPEETARQAGMPAKRQKDAARYAEYQHVKVPASKIVPRDIAGSMTQSRPDKTKSYASPEQIAEAAETGGNSDLSGTHLTVPDRKKVNGPVSSPDGYEGSLVQGKIDGGNNSPNRVGDKAALAPSYQFSTTNKVRVLTVEDPNPGEAQRAADKQLGRGTPEGLKLGNSTQQPNSGVNEDLYERGGKK